MIGFGTDVVVLFYLSMHALPTVRGAKYHNPNPNPTVSDKAGSLVELRLPEHMRSFPIFG